MIGYYDLIVRGQVATFNRRRFERIKGQSVIVPKRIAASSSRTVFLLWIFVRTEFIGIRFANSVRILLVVHPSWET